MDSILVCSPDPTILIVLVLTGAGLTRLEIFHSWFLIVNMVSEKTADLLLAGSSDWESSILFVWISFVPVFSVLVDCGRVYLMGSNQLLASPMAGENHNNIHSTFFAVPIHKSFPPTRYNPLEMAVSSFLSKDPLKYLAFLLFPHCSYLVA
jgi:hypothetical protein